MFDFIRIQYQLDKLTAEQVQGFVPRWLTAEQVEAIINWEV